MDNVNERGNVNLIESKRNAMGALSKELAKYNRVSIFITRFNTARVIAKVGYRYVRNILRIDTLTMR